MARRGQEPPPSSSRPSVSPAMPNPQQLFGGHQAWLPAYWSPYFPPQMWISHLGMQPSEFQRQPHPHLTTPTGPPNWSQLHLLQAQQGRLPAPATPEGPYSGFREPGREQQGRRTARGVPDASPLPVAPTQVREVMPSQGRGLETEAPQAAPTRRGARRGAGANAHRAQNAPQQRGRQTPGPYPILDPLAPNPPPRAAGDRTSKNSTLVEALASAGAPTDVGPVGAQAPGSSGLTAGSAGASGVTAGKGPSPQRASLSPCLYYMRTGECKFGDACKYAHPDNLKPQFTSAGLPIRPGQRLCPFHENYKWCGFGKCCKFSHRELPPKSAPDEEAQAAAQEEQNPAQEPVGGEADKLGEATELPSSEQQPGEPDLNDTLNSSLTLQD